MKKPLLYILLALSSLSAMSQSVPQTINYQGIARRADGSTINGRQLGLKFEILQGGPTGTSVFSEIQAQSTNTLGLFNAQIGSVTNLGTVDWTASSYYLSVSVDTAGGNSYVFLGTQKMVSVPYALAAGSAPSPTLSYNNNILTVGSSSVGIYVGGASPNLSINGNTLSITGGTPVVLPGAPVVGSGATTVALVGGNYRVHSDTIALKPTLYGYGMLSVGGSYPNFQIGFVPNVNYNASTGVLTLTQPTGYVGGPPILVPIAPTPVISGNLLAVGPSTNNVDMNPIAPWRYSYSTNAVTLGVVGTVSVGINNIALPSAELEVTGYTKLGDNTSPGIKMVKLTGLTAAATGTTSITIPSVITPAKILAVSVMVELTNNTGNWIPPGYNPNLTSGLDYSWKITPGTPNTIDIVNSATSSANITAGKNIKVLITYEQ